MVQLLSRTTTFWYDAAWRVVQETQRDQTNGAGTLEESIIQQVWGARYIIEVVAAAAAPAGARIAKASRRSGERSSQELAFQLTDAQFSVIAVATPGKPGVVIDRIAYSPYGEATRTLRSDVNGDGFVNKDDYAGIIKPRTGAAIGTAAYVVEADLDRDGKITQTDYDISIADDGKSSSGGVGEAGLFSRGVRNSIGYCGYIFNEDSGLYTVRFRTYSPTLGRWLERDPLDTPAIWPATSTSITMRPQFLEDRGGLEGIEEGLGQYADGMSLYQYVGSDSISRSDPPGLGPIEWILTGDWDPAPEVLEAAKCGYIEGLGMNPFNTSQSLGQLLYTGRASASPAALRASICAATEVADCWKSCMAEMNQELLGWGAVVSGTGVAPVPKLAVRSLADALRLKELARWVAAGSKSTNGWTCGARVSSLALKLYGGRWVNGPQRFFHSIAELVKQRLATAPGLSPAQRASGVMRTLRLHGPRAARGGVVVVALVEAAFSAHCGWRCSR